MFTLVPPRVALIHATPDSMQPAWSAFAEEFPEAELWNVLDDRLVVEADEAGGLTPVLRARMRSLLEYVNDAGADAIQLTCSMYGPATADLGEGWGIPVVASDQAMYEAVADAGYEKVALVGSLASAVRDSNRRLNAALTERGAADPEVVEVVSRDVREALRRGDHSSLRDALGEAARSVSHTVDAVLVAQYSVAGGLTPDLHDEAGIPVLDPPHLAARALRTRLDVGA